MPDVLVIVDRHERTEASIAVLSGTVAGTLARVELACDARTVVPVLAAIAAGERVPIHAESWQIIGGTVPEPVPDRRPA